MVRGVLEINLNFLEENVRKVKKALPQNVRYLSVAKADAYGLGIEKITLFLGNRQHPLVDGFAVLNVQEALAIRSLDISLPICILSPLLKDELEDLRRAQAIPLISSIDELHMLQNFARKEQFIQKIHVKIDTGMGRLGVWFEDVEKFFSYAANCNHLEICGLATHFSSTLKDNAFTQSQLLRFQDVIRKYAKPNWLNHASSSFGIDRFLEGTNGVRIGALQCGIPEDNALVKRLQLQPIIRLSTVVVLVKYVPAKTKVGYEQTYCLPKDTKIAVLSLGYADGIPIALSNCGEVLIRGQRCKIIGRVSMDQVTVDVTALEDVAVGDEAVFFGRQGTEEIPFSEFAQRAQLLMRAAFLASLSERRITRKYLPEVFSLDCSPEMKNSQSFFSPF
ncbi:MAG: alanine racemase [Puniceicoccales bacterium]|jgi:alanine racemase|nr:alanine racemase [Puniceicoccales bacterium]